MKLTFDFYPKVIFEFFHFILNQNLIKILFHLFFQYLYLCMTINQM